MALDRLQESQGRPSMISKEGVHAFNYGMALVRNIFERQEALDAGEGEKAKTYDSTVKGLSEKLRNEFSIDPDQFLYEVMVALQKNWEGRE